MSKKLSGATKAWMVFGKNSKRQRFGGRTFSSYETARKFVIRAMRKAKSTSPSFYPAIGIDGDYSVRRVA